MFGWFQPHRSSYAKSRILDPIQNPTNLKVFKISRLQRFHWILSCMRVWNLHLTSLCTLLLVVLIVKLLYHDLNQNVPFSQTKSLIKHDFFSNPTLFNAWFRKFQQNCKVLSNVLQGSTSGFKLEARTKS